MRFFTLFLPLFITSGLMGQTTADFENLFPGEESFNLSSGADRAFVSGNMMFPNDYNEAFMSFNGWAISSTTDTETPGFSNQSSAISGSGNNGSATYAFAYAFDPIRVIPGNEAAGGTMDGFYITNSTYTYWSMLNGDQFSKKFGGIDGNDPDYLLLTIEAYQGGSLKANKIEFYLADYRFQDNSKDYIVDKWTWVDLKPLGNADSLEFSLSSSDNGDFGMNTPAYFCIDDFVSLDGPTSIAEIEAVDLAVFPNPSSDYLIVHSAEPMNIICILNMTGKIVFSDEINSDQSYHCHIEHLPKGIYYLSVETNKGYINRKWVKQ